MTNRRIPLIAAQPKPIDGAKTLRYGAATNTMAIPIALWFVPGKGGIGTETYDYKAMGAGLTLTFYRVCIPDLEAEEYLRKDTPLAYGLAARMKRGKLSKVGLSLACHTRIVRAPISDAEKTILLDFVNTYAKYSSPEIRDQFPPQYRTATVRERAATVPFPLPDGRGSVSEGAGHQLTESCTKLSKKEEAEMQDILDSEPEYSDVKQSELTWLGKREFAAATKAAAEAAVARRQEALEALLDLCEVLNIQVPPEQRTRLVPMDLNALKSLRHRIKHERRWPSE